MSHVPWHLSRVICNVSRVRCHMSHFFFGIKWQSLSVEGLLSMGPTMSSFYSYSYFILSQFEFCGLVSKLFESFITIWFFCCNFSLFEFLDFVKIQVVLSQLDFLSFVAIWVHEFCPMKFCKFFSSHFFVWFCHISSLSRRFQSTQIRVLCNGTADRRTTCFKGWMCSKTM